MREPSSHPTRGAWIETSGGPDSKRRPWSHPTRGAWIETLIRSPELRDVMCRTPPGVRGLKLRLRDTEGIPPKSHPTRGAWIETWIGPKSAAGRGTSHPTRGAWIETVCKRHVQNCIKSHPTRGAWIETVNGLLRRSVVSSHPTRGAWIETD